MKLLSAQKGFATVFKLLLGVIILFLCFVNFDKTVLADIAAPITNNQGGSVGSSGNTPISMDYEKVIVSCVNGKQDDGAAPLICHVSAVFKMKNNSATNQTIPIVFPADGSQFTGLSGYGGGELQNFKAQGKLIEEVVNSKLQIQDKSIDQIKTYQWTETFQSAELKEITVEYDTEAPKNYASVYTLSYVLSSGATWQGSIGGGEISFTFPWSLTDYSLGNPAPEYGSQQRTLSSRLNRTVSGKTVTFSFNNYEPKYGEEIAFGVYDPEQVNKILELKKQPVNFANTLKIADLFQTLSIGPHCSFCHQPAGMWAMDNYRTSVTLADSEDELLDVLANFAHTSATLGQDASQQKIRDRIRMNFQLVCTDPQQTPTHLDCLNEIYRNPYGPGFGFTVLGLDNFKQDDIPEKEFLYSIAKKMQLYNAELATDIENYATNAKSVAAQLKELDLRNVKNDSTPKTESTTPGNPPEILVQSANQPLLLVLILLLAGSMTAVVIIVRKSGIHKPLKDHPESLTTDTLENEKPIDKPSKKSL